MGFRNALTASDAAVVVASSSPVKYVALQVITSSDLTFLTGAGNTVTLTAAPVGTRLDVIVTQVSVCSGVVVGYIA